MSSRAIREAEEILKAESEPLNLIYLWAGPAILWLGVAVLLLKSLKERGS